MITDTKMYTKEIHHLDSILDLSGKFEFEAQDHGDFMFIIATDVCRSNPPCPKKDK